MKLAKTPALNKVRVLRARIEGLETTVILTRTALTLMSPMRHTAKSDCLLCAAYKRVLSMLDEQLPPKPFRDVEGLLSHDDKLKNHY